MKKLNLLFAVGLLPFLVISCSQETNNQTQSRNTNNNSSITSTQDAVNALKNTNNQNTTQSVTVEKPSTAVREQLEMVEDGVELTTMEITPAVANLGNIPKGKPVTQIFKIKNTGDNPLIINDAKASCGCTVPSKPEKPIAPGEEDELTVVFTSTPTQKGTKINKRIHVSANILEGSKYVIIRGEVED